MRAFLPTFSLAANPIGAASFLLKVCLLLSLGSVAQGDQATVLVPGSTITLTSTADGSQPFTYQWKKNGVSIVGATQASLVLAAVASVDAGSYSVVVTNSAGSATSDSAILTAPTAPVISTQPATPPTVSEGQSAVFSVTATSAPPATLQWQVSTDDGITWSNLSTASAPPATLHWQAGTSEGANWSNLSNEILYAGIRTSTLTVSRIPAGSNLWITTSTLTVIGIPAGFRHYLFRAVATSSAGSSVSSPALLGSSLVNLSIRAQTGRNDAAMIVGFVIDGGPAKSLLVRGIGPTLGLFGVPDFLSDPILSLNSKTSAVATNDNWESNSNIAQVVATSARLGAFALPSGSRDAVLLSTLGRGDNSAELSGRGTAAGIALFELYDADPLGSARLVNVSARTTVGTEDRAPIVGFVIEGNVPKQLLLRAIGPALSGFGVPSTLADPQLGLYRQGEDTPLLHNDNWGGTAALRAAFNAAGAFTLDEPSRDAAMVVALAPGHYTVQVSGVDSTTGVVLIEVYELSVLP